MATCLELICFDTELDFYLQFENNNSVYYKALQPINLLQYLASRLLIIDYSAVQGRLQVLVLLWENL